MERAYHKWQSPILQREMELLVFGHSGARIIFFPTRKARFFDYENWGIIDSIKEQIEKGLIQIFCVDSYDKESFYASNLSPAERIIKHVYYENYILNEVLPFSEKLNSSYYLVAAGCSLGGYHALNIAFKHPNLFNKVVGMSGRYDLTQAMGVFKDLFDGFIDDNIYYNTPNRFIPNLTDPKHVEAIRKMEIIIAVGQEDAFIDDNQFMSHILWEKGIPNQLHIWNEEAHDPAQWKQMVKFYF